MSEIDELRKRCANLESFRYENEVLYRRLVRAELMHHRTAEHLKETRRKLRHKEVELALQQGDLRNWKGSEDNTTRAYTPKHYRGDGRVTCARALSSAMSQRSVAPFSGMALYWWCSAFKYVWRMWSKGDPEGDALKAIDCLRRCMKEVANG